MPLFLFCIMNVGCANFANKKMTRKASRHYQDEDLFLENISLFHELDNYC